MIYRKIYRKTIRSIVRSVGVARCASSIVDDPFETPRRRFNWTAAGAPTTRRPTARWQPWKDWENASTFPMGGQIRKPTGPSNLEKLHQTHEFSSYADHFTNTKIVTHWESASTFPMEEKSRTDRTE